MKKQTKALIIALLGYLAIEEPDMMEGLFMVFSEDIKKRVERRANKK